MNEADIREVVRAAGGATQVAKRLGVSVPRVSMWTRRGIPDDRVIAWCRAVEWRRTPHQVAPHLYPHPLDGLPAQMRPEAA